MSVLPTPGTRGRQGSAELGSASSERPPSGLEARVKCGLRGSAPREGGGGGGEEKLGPGVGAPEAFLCSHSTCPWWVLAAHRRTTPGVPPVTLQFPLSVSAVSSSPSLSASLTAPYAAGLCVAVALPGRVCWLVCLYLSSLPASPSLSLPLWLLYVSATLFFSLSRSISHPVPP